MMKPNKPTKNPSLLAKINTSYHPPEYKKITLDILSTFNSSPLSLNKTLIMNILKLMYVSNHVDQGIKLTIW